MGAGKPTLGIKIHYVVAWMAPEIMEDPAHFNPAADVYSFAMVTWEMLTGRSPNQGKPSSSSY
jgi:serine/threonine protein kinase